ncbi:MAG: hypothetical protein AB4038_10650 [Prochloraceae cyanobacterium]
MIISELNHLEVMGQEKQIVGGITDQKANTHLNFFEKVDINKYVDAKAYVRGNIAFAEADAVALGYDSVSNALSNTYTDYKTSVSTATSSSATGDYYYYW